MNSSQNIKINKYPFNKDCAFAITIDDLHPESKYDKNKLDFGMDEDSDFWKRVNLIHNSNPEIAITLFTVPNWVDITDFPSGMLFPLRKIYRKRRSYNKNRFKISADEFNNWIEFLNQQKKNIKIEYAMHGNIHHSFSNSTFTSEEFLQYSNEETEAAVDDMFNIFKNSGLNYSKGFRQPGWGINKNQLEILNKHKIDYIAGSSNFIDPVNGKNLNGAGIKDTPISSIGFFENTNYLPYFTANTYVNQIERAVEIAKSNGIIILHAHIAPTVLGLKYVDKSFPDSLSKLLREIKYQSAKDIWFATLGEISSFQAHLNNISVKQTEKETILEVSNNNTSSVSGLTVSLNNVSRVIDKIEPHEKKVIDFSVHNIYTQEKKVSIVLSVFNGAKTIIPSLDSLANQSYTNTEIIVVNDGSTDNTPELVKNYITKSEDNRISLINQPNMGRSRARNAGLWKSSGEVVTFAEDDAYYRKSYVQLSLQNFKNDSDGKLAGTIGPHYVWNKHDSFNTRVKDIERRRNFYNYNPKTCWFYKRELINSIGGFNENMELAEDIEPSIKLAKMGYRFEYQPEAIWLHMEPSNFKKYLRRKFRGGIGIAILKKMKLRENIIPLKVVLILFMFAIASIGLVVYTPVFVFPLILLSTIGAILVRYKSIKIARQISDENILFICFGIIVEYIWWTATLCGYIKGNSMKVEEINKYLKGR